VPTERLARIWHVLPRKLGHRIDGLTDLPKERNNGVYFRVRKFRQASKDFARARQTRVIFGLGSAIALTFLGNAAAAQTQNLLENAQRTAIYVETSYDGNDGRERCDWYTAATDFIATTGSLEEAYGNGCRIDIRLRGTINRDGASLFAKLIRRLESMDLYPAGIVLDSRGGEATAAIAIARAIRDSEIFRRVPVETRVAGHDQAVCFSACIVIFAAGYRRSAEFDIYGDDALPSRLGIHGPGQFDRSAGRYDTSADNADIQRIRRRLKEFFASIDVSPELVDDMFAVPFDEIRLLGRQELIDYGLYAD